LVVLVGTEPCISISSDERKTGDTADGCVMYLSVSIFGDDAVSTTGRGAVPPNVYPRENAV
jgi:hypothetical protein